MAGRTSWRDIEPYGRWAEPLAEELARLIRVRRPGAAEEAVRETAGWLALLCVLSAEYGAGDAMAGYILRRIERRITVEQVREVLMRLGVLGVPEYGRAMWRFCNDVARAGDWRDERVTKMMRGLYDYAVSGGRKQPEWYRGG